MAGSKFIERQKVLKFIDQVPFTEKDKKKWHKALEEDDLTEELVDEVHKKLMDLPAEKFSNDWMKAKFSVELAQTIRQWRMGTASKTFRHGH